MTMILRKRPMPAHLRRAAAQRTSAYEVSVHWRHLYLPAMQLKRADRTGQKVPDAAEHDTAAP
jgi:hypothetical protein